MPTYVHLWLTLVPLLCTTYVSSYVTDVNFCLLKCSFVFRLFSFDCAFVFTRLHWVSHLSIHEYSYVYFFCSFGIPMKATAVEYTCMSIVQTKHGPNIRLFLGLN